MLIDSKDATVEMTFLSYTAARASVPSTYENPGQVLKRPTELKDAVDLFFFFLYML